VPNLKYIALTVLEQYTFNVLKILRVTWPTTPIWQTASVPSSLINCGLHKPRLLPTCPHHPLVFQLYSGQHGTYTVSRAPVRVYRCDTMRGGTLDPTCIQQKLAAGHHTDAVDETVQEEDFSRHLSSGQHLLHIWSNFSCLNESTCTGLVTPLLRKMIHLRLTLVSPVPVCSELCSICVCYGLLWLSTRSVLTPVLFTCQ